MWRLAVITGLVGIVTACGRPASPDTEPYVVVISIDGLSPAAYTTPGPAQVPTLRRLAQSGAWADGVIGVTPSVTYPSHTTLLTGVSPSDHGIYNNRIFDVEDTSGGSWYWYARDVKVETLHSAVKKRGLSTGAVNWPVTVGADIDYLIPEFGGVYDHPIWLNLLRALTRPHGLLDTLEAGGQRLQWPMADADEMALAAAVFRQYRPHLLLVHLVDVDDREHTFGAAAPETLTAIETADAQVKLMVDTITATGLLARTNIVVVSDHGFESTEQELRPNVALKNAGLLEEDDYGKVRRWDAYFQPSGGSGFVMLHRPDDAGLRDRVGNIVKGLARDPLNGIDTIWEQADLQKMGADPRAAFGIAMKPGFSTSAATDVLTKPVGARGEHGYAPTRAAMHASLIMNGPMVGAGGNLGIVRMTQIAPTIASWFGASLSTHADGLLSFQPRDNPPPR